MNFRLKNYRDRAPDNLNQYRRHKPLDSDSVVGLPRVYPEPVDVQDDEDEPELQNDDNVSATVYMYKLLEIIKLKIILGIRRRQFE